MYSVAKGRLIIYRLFEVSSGIDLAAVESKAREGARRLRISRQPCMKAIEFANPPVSFDLSPYRARLFGREAEVQVVARAYDFGILTVAFEIPIPEGTSMTEVELVTRGIEADPGYDARALEYASAVVDDLGEAALDPEVKEGFVEDYMVIYIEGFTRPASTEEFLAGYDPSRLLLYEERELSPSTRKETLSHAFSYYPDDLVVLHTDNALVIEPSGSADLPDLLEFANAQMLELRYYDDVMDRELAWVYGAISRRRRTMTIFGIRKYQNIARKLSRTVTDITEVTERVNNALKVTEDIYYAKVYRAAMALMRVGDWESSVAEKLQVVMNTNKMLHDEMADKRGYAVEVGIFFLIVIDIILVVLGV